MANGTTGQIVFQSINSSQVFSNVVGNCSVGSSIDVDRGVYVVNAVWTLSHVSNVSLNFESGAELIAGKNLDSPVLFLNNANNCYLSGVTIDGNAANQAVGTYPLFANGILIAGSYDEVAGATIFNCRVMGVMISTYGSVQGSVEDGVINSKLYDCGWNGFGVENPHNVACYATDNVVYGCSDVGISTYGTGTQIKGNYVHDMNGTTGGGGNAEWGIGVEGGSNATITQNTVQNCSIGIEDSGLNYCVISKNLVTGTSQARPQYGILLSNVYGTGGCEYNSVTDNNVTGMYCNTVTYLGGVGIFLQGAAFNSVVGNYVSQCGSGGIYLDATANNNTVTQNTVFDQLSGTYYSMAIGCSGIEIGGSSNNISQNQAFDDRSGAARTQQYGIALDLGAYENVLSGNNAYGNVKAQIYNANTP
jgi:parallel beta-helix repeat protein